jgi:hypothetical protein
MNENWINERLCSFDEKTRVELGPQVIQLKCTDENLQDTVTSPHYRVGQRDAFGKIIMPEKCVNPEEAMADPYGYVSEGGEMSCVDWREKHVPMLWKIYKFEAELDDDGEPLINNGEVVGKFVKVGEDENKDEAVNFARTLAGEM